MRRFLSQMLQGVKKKAAEALPLPPSAPESVTVRWRAPWGLKQTTMDDTAKLSRQQWRIVWLASLGGSLEFYDFIIYGLFVPYISHQFFPSDNPTVSLILSFSVLALGFLARPLGGLILGRFGDRYGRRPVFVASLGLTTLATILIGLLPSYQHWGLLSPILLVAIRAVQGMCLGGELPGALTYAVEAAPKRSGLAGGVIILCLNAGVLLALCVNLCIHTFLSPDEIASYGWRVAFLLGGVIGIVSFRLRRRLEESPEFLKLQRGPARTPLRDLLTRNKMTLLVGAGVTAAMAGYNGLLFGFLPTYLVNSLHYPSGQAALAMAVALVPASITTILAGWAADFFPRYLLLRAGTLLMLLISYPFYAMMVGHVANIVLLVSGLSLAFSIISGTWPSVLAALFPTETRFSGIALSYNISITLLSGFAPLAATVLIAHTGNVASPGLLVAGCSALGLLSSFFVQRYTA